MSSDGGSGGFVSYLLALISLKCGIWYLWGQYSPSAIFEETKKFMKSKVFGDYDYTPLIDSLEGNEGFGKADYFLVGKDFPSYVECQEKVAKAYKDPDVRRSYP